MVDNLHSGRLIVITGLAGAGKDAVIKVLQTKLPKCDFIVSYTTRAPRPGEIHGRDHYFVKDEELDRLYYNNELVEEPVITGNSRKATARREFEKVLLKDFDVIWRVTPSLAAKIADGSFFEEQFNPEKSTTLKNKTIIFFLTSSQEILEKRRKARDQNNYDPTNYIPRDQEDIAVLKKLGPDFKYIVLNDEDKLEETAEQILSILKSQF